MIDFNATLYLDIFASTVQVHAHVKSYTGKTTRCTLNYILNTNKTFVESQILTLFVLCLLNVKE